MELTVKFFLTVNVIVCSLIGLKHSWPFLSLRARSLEVYGKFKDFTLFYFILFFLQKPLRIGVQVFSKLMMSSQCQIAPLRSVSQNVLGRSARSKFITAVNP